MGNSKTFRAICAMLTLCAAAAYADCEVKITSVKLGTVTKAKNEWVTVTVDYSITPGANCTVVEATLDVAVRYVLTDQGKEKETKIATIISNASFKVDPGKTSDTFELSHQKKTFCSTIDNLKKNKNVSGITLVATISATCLCKGKEESILDKGSDSFSVPQSKLDEYCQ